MKVLHSYCLNYNIGDYALGIGVKNLLRNYLDIDLIAETNLQGRVFNEYYIDNVVNKKYDLLVIGGGGIIHGAHWPNGWFWLINEDLIDRIKIPFIVYGAGYNYFKDEGGIPEIGRRHLKKTVEKAAYFSIRNDGSVERFYEQMGFVVPEIPDPGFHINVNKSYGCQETAPFVLVQLANDKPEHRFGSEMAQTSFVNEMREVTKRLSQKYKVIFAPHVFDDVSLSHQVADGINNVAVWDFSKYAFDNCSGCIGFYEKAEFVLAMRGHGQILPIAFNTPVISLENHPKHSGLMSRLHLDDFNVTLSKPGFMDNISTAISLLEGDRGGYINRLKKINETLAIQTEDAFNKIKLAIGNN